MNTKINIAELLKDCPKGMELDCALFENLEFDYIDKNSGPYPIRCRIKTEWGSYNVHTFTEYGCYGTEKYSKCVIFPKGKTTWEGFYRPFKDGDVVSTKEGHWIGITTGGKKGEFIPTYCVINSRDKFEAYLDRKEKWQFFRLATEEEKAKLFKAIKDNGYKWNEEKKILEKLPKFKVGDVIQNEDEYKVKITEVNVEDECYEYESMIAKGIGGIGFIDQDNWKLVPNKFDITTLKPFKSKVLVRNYGSDYWKPATFGFTGKDKNAPFCVEGGNFFNKCIPYEGNEHLLGTTDDCDEFYKTW